MLKSYSAQIIQCVIIALHFSDLDTNTFLHKYFFAQFGYFGTFPQEIQLNNLLKSYDVFHQHFPGHLRKI